MRQVDPGPMSILGDVGVEALVQVGMVADGVGGDQEAVEHAPADGIIWIRPEDFGPLNQRGWTRIE